MSSNWDNLKNQDSPRDQQIKQQQQLQNQARAYAARFFQVKIEAKKWDVNKHLWNHERQRLYRILGLQKTNNTYTQVDGVYNTGRYEFVKGYGDSYSLREKQSVDTTTMYVLEVDTSKIRDFNKWLDIKNRVDRFLYEAERKFGKNMVPGYFNRKERFKLQNYGWILAITFIIPVVFMFACIGIAVDRATYNKNNAQWLPLAEAYFEQVEEFEKEIAEIANFGYKPRKKPYIKPLKKKRGFGAFLKGMILGMLCGGAIGSVIIPISAHFVDAGDRSIHPFTWILLGIIAFIGSIWGGLYSLAEYKRKYKEQK